MRRPNPLQVKDGSMPGIRYSGAKVSAAVLGIGALAHLTAGVFNYEIPISGEQVLALAGLIVGIMGIRLRKGME